MASHETKRVDWYGAIRWREYYFLYLKSTSPSLEFSGLEPHVLSNGTANLKLSLIRSTRYISRYYFFEIGSTHTIASIISLYGLSLSKRRKKILLHETNSKNKNFSGLSQIRSTHYRSRYYFFGIGSTHTIVSIISVNGFLWQNRRKELCLWKNFKQQKEKKFSLETTCLKNKNFPACHVVITQ